jgi:hypothetical protein
MVDPIDNARRAAFYRKVRAGFVALVALSGALVAIQAGGGPLGVVAALLAGSLVGAVLAWLALPDPEDLDTREGRRSGRR